MRSPIRLLLLAPLFLFMRCPYVSNVPIQGKVINYDPMLTGLWRYEGEQLRIAPIDDRNFKFQYWSRGEQPGEGLNGNAQLRLLDARRLFVASVVEKGKTQYLIFRLDTLDAQQLAITWLDDEEVGKANKVFSSPKAFTAFVKKAGVTESYRIDFRRGPEPDSTRTNHR